jgi:3-hydroxybutyryl-CoA dehydratase
MGKQLSYDEIVIGQTAFMKKYVSAEDVKSFAEILNDNESFHISDEAAGKSPFKKRICHGIHIASYISELIGKELPGFGTIYCNQTINFINPLYIDSYITIEVTVLEKLNGHRIKIFTEITDDNNNKILDGNAIVKTCK